MPKMRTCKTAAKRFEVTGTGKIRHGATGMNHLKMKKCASAKRRLAIKGEVTTGQKRVIRRQIPGM